VRATFNTPMGAWPGPGLYEQHSRASKIGEMMMISFYIHRLGPTPSPGRQPHIYTHTNICVLTLKICVNISCWSRSSSSSATDTPSSSLAPHQHSPSLTFSRSPPTLLHQHGTQSGLPTLPCPTYLMLGLPFLRTCTSSFLSWLASLGITTTLESRHYTMHALASYISRSPDSRLGWGISPNESLIFIIAKKKPHAHR
jgi:hypothetical protein